MASSTRMRGGAAETRAGRRASDKPSRRRLHLDRVSIHAPARGATETAPSPALPAHCFNPRPRTGGDARRAFRHDRLTVFQSTPPHGGRRPRIDLSEPDASRFNPRPRAGGDADRHQPAAASEEFQSTPPRGGRRSGVIGPRSAVWFQSTPPRGGRRRGQLGRCEVAGVSIHAPARGATPSSRSGPWPCGCFNPRPRAGGDRVGAQRRPPRVEFQSTPPHGGRRS